MPTQENAVAPARENGDIVSVYDTPEHKALRKQLGFSETPRELPEWAWKPSDAWESLQGIMSEFADEDTTEVKARERALELAHDERKFGPIPNR